MDARPLVPMSLRHRKHGVMRAVTLMGTAFAVVVLSMSHKLSLSIKIPGTHSTSASLLRRPLCTINDGRALTSGILRPRFSKDVDSFQSQLGLAIRSDFPILDQTVHEEKPLVYLDSAATSQNPREVTNAIRRASEELANTRVRDRVMVEYEEARTSVSRFVNAQNPREIVFVKGATEAMNLVAKGWGSKHIKGGDEIILSVMEHHANLVPWQILAEKTGAKLKFVPLTADQSFDIEVFKTLLNPGKTKIVAINHVSNVLGCPNPVEEVTRLAHEAGALVSLDACQSVPHMPVDVQKLGVDFLSASGHKMLGPTGIGFLWARPELLESMDPIKVGGGESSYVSIEEEDEKNLQIEDFPWKFESGSPPVPEAIGLATSIKYLESIGMEKIHEYEKMMGKKLYEALSEIPGVSIYGPPPDSPAGKERGALVTFNCEGVHANDLAFFLDQEGVAIRSGHHCAQPLHRALGVAGSARASLYVYNVDDDIYKFTSALKKTLKLLSDFGFSGIDDAPCPLTSTSDPTLKDPGIDRPCTDLWPRIPSENEKEQMKEEDYGNKK
mmetsp:Transcript_21584/g.32119  ORF Transcript_21584/g.32119 Transcript_21584/m.32119 type:complete len:556 (+) Transcript_21584:68-1735(+)